MTQAPARLSADVPKEFATRGFQAVGRRADDAVLVADSLVAAELRGVTSHGLVRLPVYLPHLLDGSISPTCEGGKWDTGMRGESTHDVH
jgi:LDH2 family malate/lactate/ureidoglycolate dehydrogenase